MAGSGRRVFAPGEVLTASNTMNYLMDQTVMNFAGTAARGSAIGTAVAEGMVSYLADTNDVQVYDGSAWNDLAYQSAVDSLPTPGLIPIVPSSVAVGSGSGSRDTTTGLVTFTGATSITVNGVFSSTYRAYKILFRTSSASAGATCTYRFAQSGTATTANLWYGHGFYYGINGAPAAISAVNAQPEIYCQSVVASGYNNISTSAEITIQDNRYVIQASGFPNNAGGVNAYALYNLTPMSSLDGFRIAMNTGNFTGTLKVYGYN